MRTTPHAHQRIYTKIGSRAGNPGAILGESMQRPSSDYFRKALESGLLWTGHYHYYGRHCQWTTVDYPLPLLDVAVSGLLWTIHYHY
ncbi:MAG: hypothetical protein ABFR47_07200 [Verrucomicrobiota bacterium]